MRSPLERQVRENSMSYDIKLTLEAKASRCHGAVRNRIRSGPNIPGAL